MGEKNLANFLSVDSSEQPVVKYKIFQKNFVKTR
jgi:hypothetical protein